MALEFAFVSALLVVYGTSYVFTFLRRWDVPLLAVEILAGIVFGSAFGFISPGSAGYDFFEALAAFGLLMIMFDAGLELDPEVVREDPLRVAKLGLLTFVLPFLAGVGFALALSLSPFAAYLTGVTVSTTSLGLIYPLVEDYGLVDDDRGQLILSVTVLNDILSVAALAYGVTLVTSDSPVLGVGLVTLALGFFFVVLPFVLADHISNTVREGVVSNPVKFGVFLMIALAFAVEEIGVHAVLGAFFAGLLVAIVTSDGHRVERDMRPITDLTAPVFFFYVGMNVDLGAIGGADPLLLGGVLVLGLGTKVVGAALGGRIAGLGGDTTRLLTAAMPGRLSISVAAAEIGLSRGIIGKPLYDAFVLLSVVSVFVAVVAFRYVANGAASDAI